MLGFLYHFFHYKLHFLQWNRSQLFHSIWLRRHQVQLDPAYDKQAVLLVFC